MTRLLRSPQYNRPHEYIVRNVDLFTHLTASFRNSEDVAVISKSQSARVAQQRHALHVSSQHSLQRLCTPALPILKPMARQDFLGSTADELRALARHSLALDGSGHAGKSATEVTAIGNGCRQRWHGRIQTLKVTAKLASIHRLKYRLRCCTARDAPHLDTAGAPRWCADVARS